MCGIGAMSLTTPNDQGPELMRSLACALVPRGRHASGYGWHDEHGWPWSWNAPGSAGQTCYDAPLDDAPIQTGIVHTRFATKGDPANPHNNHPVTQPGIVLVHNGSLRNDDELFARYPQAQRQGEVDSEALAAMLAFDERHPTAILPQVRGLMAIAWLDTVSDSLHLARGQGRPLHVAQNRRGDFVAASTAQCLNDALRWEPWFGKLVWRADLPEGHYVRVRAGRVVESRDFKVNRIKVDQRIVAMTDGGRTAPKAKARKARKVHTVPSARTLFPDAKYSAKEDS